MSLQKIQQELKAPKGQFNNFGKYNYRSCEDILEGVKPLLDKYNMTLLLSDEMIEIGGRVYVKATAQLGGEKGIVATVTACARESETKKGMDDSQITGSTSSYARKYALNGLFCIDDTKDADATNDHGKGKQDEGRPFSPSEDLQSCKTMSELKKVFSALTKAEQKKYAPIKDQMKTKLDK